MDIDQNQLLHAAQVRANQLEIIMEITRELSLTLDLEKLLALIMNSAKDILNAGSGSLFLVDEATQDLVFRVVTSGESNLIGTHIPFGKGIVGQVASISKPLVVMNVANDDRFFGALEHSEFHTQSLLAVPLRVPDRLIGVVELINKVDGTDFSEEDSELLMTFAAQAAIAIENARLYQETLEKQRLEQELELAFKVQSSLIPRTTPVINGWDFAAWWQPAKEVSGDFYDFIHSDNRLGIVIADVSDKGMHAALFMALTRSILRASTIATQMPAENLTRANRLVCADSTGGMFVTLFSAQIDLKTNQLTYVNCGHNPPLWYQKEADTFVELRRTALMMGFDNEMECEQKDITLKSDDCLVLYTDGLTEAFNANREQFGKERLQSVIRSYTAASAGQMLGALLESLENHTVDVAQSDDITLVIIKRI